MNSTHFIYIADVYCPWCYAFGPIMKRLADEHPDIPVMAYGGSLVSEPSNLREMGLEDPGLAQFWREVEQTSGRDLGGALAALRDGYPVRVYSPGADMILESLKKLSPGHDLEQLLCLEDMFYAQGLDLFDDSSIERIARRWRLDPQTLADTVNSGDIERATGGVLAQDSRLMGEITSYPSVLLARNGKVDAVSRGYVHYETVAQRLEDAMRDLGVETGQDLYCSWHGGCSLGGGRKK